jgi:hypothetical protein
MFSAVSSNRQVILQNIPAAVLKGTVPLYRRERR